MNAQIQGSAGRQQIVMKTGLSASECAASDDHVDVVRMAEAEALHRVTRRHANVAEAAYLLAEQRGFAPGHEIDDWLQAELQVEAAERLTLLCPADAITPAELACQSPNETRS